MTGMMYTTPVLARDPSQGPPYPNRDATFGANLAMRPSEGLTSTVISHPVSQTTQYFTLTNGHIISSLELEPNSQQFADISTSQGSNVQIVNGYTPVVSGSQNQPNSQSHQRPFQPFFLPVQQTVDSNAVHRSQAQMRGSNNPHTQLNTQQSQHQHQQTQRMSQDVPMSSDDDDYVDFDLMAIQDTATLDPRTDKLTGPPFEEIEEGFRRQWNGH